MSQTYRRGTGASSDWWYDITIYRASYEASKGYDKSLCKRNVVAFEPQSYYAQ